MLRDELLARCHFPSPGQPLACAFSGGADSTALVALALGAGCDVTAVHVDHGLRPSSADEAARAAQIAARLGARFECVGAEVSPGGNLEARARAARRAALPPDAATGHTADDQAETVLINLVRGAGLDGLAGMTPGPTHPILRLRRRETHALCDELDVEPIADPSNADHRFRRNRVRAELLPLLDDIADRDVAELLARTADIVRQDAELLDRLAAALDPTDARMLAAAEPGLARRALRRWLTAGGYPPDRAAVDRAYAVVDGTHRACEISGGRRVERHAGRLRITPPTR